MAGENNGAANHSGATKRRQRRARFCGAVAFSGASALLPLAPAHAQSVAPPRNATKSDTAQPRDESGLSDTVRRQIAAVLRAKQSRTPSERKMHADLADAAKTARNETVAPGVPVLRSGLQRDMAGRVLVDLRVRVVDEATLALVRGAGGAIMYARLGTCSVRAWLPVRSLEPLLARDGFLFAEPGVRARTSVGAITTEGDKTHRADAARTTYNVTGTGIKVGVLSDSARYLAASQASGELPSSVTVVQDLPTGDPSYPGAGEGTAMLEIVHDVAPGAGLYFATALGGPQAFADNIAALRAAGCDILADDTYYPNESPFGDDLIARAVNDAVAGGALYFSAAGNAGKLDDGTASVWEGDWADSGADLLDPDSGLPLGSALRFGAGATGVYNTVAAGSAGGDVYAFWSDPLGQAENDYDLFVVSANGTALLDYSAQGLDEGLPPYENCEAFAGERIYIVRPEGGAAVASPRYFHLNAFGSRLAFATPGQIKGHAASGGAFAIAAVPASVAFGTGDPTGPFPGAYTGEQLSERFTSDGPRRVFYNADGTAITPGNLLATGGLVRQKPDLAASDGVRTSVAGFDPFFGTSASASHAAAIAALVKQKAPTLTVAQIRSVLTGGGALDIEGTGWDRDTGFGVLMADKALETVTNGPVVTVSTLVLNPATVVGGVQNSVATVTLSGAAPAGGALVTLTSSNTAVATVPASVTVAQGATTASFTVTARAVTAPQNVTIAAARGSSSAQAILTVQVRPPSPWTPVDVAVNRTDNTSRLLWKETTNRYAVWKLSATGAVQTGKYYGPITGYACEQIVIAPNGQATLLWKNPTTKQAALWTLAADLSALVKATVYNYPAGYTPSYIAADAASNLRLSWRKTTGAVALWTITPATGAVSGSATYGPYANLQDGPIAVGLDGRIRLLWRNTSTGGATLWTIPAAYGAPSAGYNYNAVAGATPSDIAVGADNKTRLQWVYGAGAEAGKIAVWKINTVVGGTGGIEVGKFYGPVAGVSPLGLSVGGDNQVRQLWRYDTGSSTGKAALWVLSDPLTAITAAYTYGPIY